MLRAALLLVFASCAGRSAAPPPTESGPPAQRAKPSALKPAIQLDVPDGFIVFGPNLWQGSWGRANIVATELDGPVFEGAAIIRQSWQLSKSFEHELSDVEEVTIDGYPGVMASMKGEKDGIPNRKLIAIFGDQHKHVILVANCMASVADDIAPALRRTFLGARWVGSGHAREIEPAFFADGLSIDPLSIGDTGVALRLPRGFHRAASSAVAGRLGIFTVLEVSVGEDSADLVGSYAEFPDPGDRTCPPIRVEAVTVDGYNGILVECRSTLLPIEMDRWSLIVGDFGGYVRINLMIHDRTSATERASLRAALLDARWTRNENADRVVYGGMIGEAALAHVIVRKDGTLWVFGPPSARMTLEQFVRWLRTQPPQENQRVSIYQYANVDTNRVRRVERTLTRLGYQPVTEQAPPVVEVIVGRDSLTVEDQVVEPADLTTVLREARAANPKATLLVVSDDDAPAGRNGRVLRAGKRFGW